MSIKYTRYWTIMLLTIGNLMAGCATMDQAECASANWHDRGLGDGEKGRKSTHYSEYRKDCSAFGIGVDTNAYGDGWKTGIGGYCTRDNGYRVGIRGSIYQNSCPAELNDRFFSSYQSGRAIFLKQVRVKALGHQVQEIGDDLAKSDLTETQRNSLAAKRKHVKRDLEIANIALLLTKSDARKQGFSVSY